MASKTFAQRPGDVLKWELNPDYCREIVTVASGAGKLGVGSVLGKITSSGKYVLSDPAATDGSETAAALLLEEVDATSADAKALVILRGPAIASKAALVFHSNVNTQAEKDAKYSELADIGIVVRDTV